MTDLFRHTNPLSKDNPTSLTEVVNPGKMLNGPVHF